MDNPQVRLCVNTSFIGGVFILVENQIIKVKVNASSLNHYLNKGYEVQVNKSICVNVKDLSTSSDKKVKVICDYCEKPIEKVYKKFIKQREIINKDACFDCFSIKQKEVVKLKYNTDSTLKLPDVIEKSKKTLFENYGVENSMQSKEVQQKFKDSMFDRYGVEFAQQSEEIKLKTKESYINNFGVEHPIYSDTVKNKVNNFRFVNGIKVSNGQFQIAELVNGSLNTNLMGFYVDILLEKEKIIIEYNGSGHDLSVKLGKISLEEFNQKEKERYDSLINNGYKLLIIENKTEKKLNKNRLESINQIINSKITENLNYYEVV